MKKFSVFILFIGNLCGIMVFLKGFLMNRSEINEMNYNNIHLDKSEFKRIIILLVDALKFEFLTHENTKPNETLHLGNINFFNDKDSNNFIFISPFYSDPPTTTLQRLKGLMTGSLPTFIDISSNFGGSKLNEDNLIQQWIYNNIKINFVGDETWVQLFPNHFNDTNSYPSFNVKDLDTVDNAVMKYINEHLNDVYDENINIIIGHMLGVDHCGHTFGKNHLQMQRKLIELNNFCKKLAIQMDNDTIIMVMGDHGMTNSGDHGGDSIDEVEAGLLVISNKPLLYHKNNNNKKKLNNINQIDIVPTLAALTSIPIPFSNLGFIISELMPNEELKHKYQKNNFLQIKNYVKSYEYQFGSFNLPNSIKELFDVPLDSLTEEKFEQLKSIQHNFREKWAQFNIILFSSGFLLSVFCLLHIFIYIIRYDNQLSKFIVLIIILLYIYDIFVDGSIICIIIMLCMIIKILLELLQTFSFSLLNIFSYEFILCLIFILNFLINFSNSFIILEDYIMKYFLITFILIRTTIVIKPILKRLSLKKVTGKFRIINEFLKYICTVKLIVTIFVFVITCLIIHLGLLFKLCREEQFLIDQSCAYINYEEIYWPSILPIGIVVLLMYWISKTDNKLKYSFHEMIIKYVIGICAILIFFFHSFQAHFIHKGLIENNFSNLLIFLPRIIIILLVLLIIMLFYKPIFMIKSFVFESLPTDRSVPSLYRYLVKEQEKQETIVIIKGIATPYSTFLYLFMVLGFLIISLFVKLPFLLGLFCSFCILILFSCLYSSSEEWKYSENLLDEISLHEISLFITILSQYSFYSTGHQATISNIPWYAAFVGYHGDHTTTSKIIPLIMIMTNVYGVCIIMTIVGLLLPLIMILIKYSPYNPMKKVQNEQIILNEKENQIKCCGEYLLFKNNEMSNKFRNFHFELLIWYGFQQGLLTLSSILSCALHKRHLMAWKIFVPKMLYSCVNLCLVYYGMILSYFIISYIHKRTISWRIKNI